MRVMVKSYGCSTNQADGSVLAGCLASLGHELVNVASDADVVVLNTCAVKGPTENRMIALCKRIPKGKKLIVSGCLPLVNFERLQKEVRFDAAVGPAAGSRIGEVVKLVSNGERVLAVEGALTNKPSLSLPRLGSSSVISIIPVSYGCLGACAYCCVAFARGRLRSYSIREIVQRVKHDVDMGFREVWLTAQDMACYGRDIDTNLAELVKNVYMLDGGFRVRVGMMTPNFVRDILEELTDGFQNEKVFKFLHLPVQSGDNEVLKRMNRLYSADELREIVRLFRKRTTMLTIATDVICGFPGETEEAFDSTMNLLEELKPDIVNVSKFFARPRTPAAKMKEGVAAQEIRCRSSIAHSLARKLADEANAKWLGWKGEILIDEIGKIAGSWVGRNFAYKPVVVKSSERLLGRAANVEVSGTFSSYLEGRIIE